VRDETPCPLIARRAGLSGIVEAPVVIAAWRSAKQRRQIMTIRKPSRIHLRGFSLLVAMIALSFACPPPTRGGGVVTACNEPGLKAALVGGGTVTFSCSGTITVLGGTITISQNTTVDGTGHNITISGGGKIQLFIVNSERTLTLKRVTVADGFNGSGDGGGVLNNGTLTVTNSTFRGNQAQTGEDGPGGNGGGICNHGSLTVTNSTFEDNTATGLTQPPIFGQGGGIFNDNDATITNSTFHDNKAFSGGGIFTGSSSDGGVLVVDSSVFYNNQITANYLGGPGIGAGGGIFNQAFITVVTDSTFFANGGTNAAGGNLYNCCNNRGTALLDNDTVDGGIAASGQGGNISNTTLDQETGTLFLENTIIANASSGMNCNGSMTDLNGNLRWPTSDPTCVGSYGNPMLGTLQNNGGPTFTMALQPGSAAIDTAIERFCPPTDQRGVIRPQGPQCDIGAFEYSTSKLQGLGVIAQLNGFVGSLLSESALDKLSDLVINPLKRSLDPDLWPGSDGNHVSGSEVFTLQQFAVENLSSFIVDSTQLAYINNLVMADRSLALVAINDKGCVSSPNPGLFANAPNPCALAAAEVAAGDIRADMGEYAEAIGHYLNAWRFTNH
jgi:hypothetical protein